MSSSVAPRLAVFAIANLAARESTLSVIPDDQDGPEKKRRAITEQRETTTRRVHIISIKPNPLLGFSPERVCKKVDMTIPAARARVT